MKIELVDFEIKGDDKGLLIALEEYKNIPFDIKRVYYIFGTQKNVRRGFHAHKHLKQIAVSVKGSCNILLDDGKSEQIITLDRPDKGLIIPKMIWHEMFDFTSDSVLLVLASDLYDEEDYIRSYKTFKEQIL